MKILFLGEGPLEGAARYLSAVLQNAGWTFDRVTEGSPIPASMLKSRYDVFILSDYSHRNFSAKSENWLCKQVESGAGLVMIGGWASFTGLVGRYKGSRIEKLLPVDCVANDDRVNWPTGAIVLRAKEHPILRGLSFTNPPTICGYHRVRVKPEGETVLQLGVLRWRAESLAVSRPLPLLTLHRRLRSAAFMTDCAPHWCGGLVDWGIKRRKILLPGQVVEIGSTYVLFLQQLVRWAGNRL